MKKSKHDSTLSEKLRNEEHSLKRNIDKNPRNTIKNSIEIWKPEEN